MSEVVMHTPRVAIIGGGPAGLSAAARLARAVQGDVVVYERESQAGGIPRHADHPGYGVRDRKRCMSGPAYAKTLVKDALQAGAHIEVRTCITGWRDQHTLQATTPSGVIGIRPEVFVFATGARERPRSARMVPGDRPEGVYTTGQLQNLVHLHHTTVGSTAVVVGAELVSWSAVMTLRKAGCTTAALVSAYRKGESYATFRLAGKLAFRTTVLARHKVVAVHGRPRVTGVEVEEIGSGKRQIIGCDTVVFTGDWIPDNELLRMAGVELDPVSLSPVTDQSMRTSVPGIFSVGNLNHPVETADVVALEGRYVVESVLAYLSGAHAPLDGVELIAGQGLRWVAPGRFAPGGRAPARERVVAWVDDFRACPVIVVRQRGRVVARKRVLWPAAPGRIFRIPASVLRAVDVQGGSVTLSLE